MIPIRSWMSRPSGDRVNNIAFGVRANVRSDHETAEPGRGLSRRLWRVARRGSQATTAPCETNGHTSPYAAQNNNSEACHRLPRTREDLRANLGHMTTDTDTAVDTRNDRTRRVRRTLWLDPRDLRDNRGHCEPINPCVRRQAPNASTYRKPDEEGERKERQGDANGQSTPVC